MKSKERCGCAHDGTRWLVICELHWAEHRAEFSDPRRVYTRPGAKASDEDWLNTEAAP